MRIGKQSFDAGVEVAPFFARLVEQEGSELAARSFGQTIARPLGAPEPEFHRALYRALVDSLLDLLDLPRTEGAAEWEWRALYEFGRTQDPHYFTEASIHALLDHWPIIGFDKREILTSVLSGYLHLRRKGFPECYPSPMMPLHEVERWLRIFPTEWAWAALTPLRRVGFATMASREGFRAYARYTDGDFEPELTSTALRRWWSHCWSAAPIMSAYHSEEVRPYAATFLAFAFAGGASAMGIAGPCGDIPDCPKCPLQADCRWQTLRERSDLTGQETLALARSGQVQHLRTDQLIQALLPAGGEDARRLLRTLGDTPLRALAGLSLPQLAERVGGAEFLPEQLTLLFELCKRFNEERMAVGVAFQTPWDIFRHFRMRLRDQKQEQFIVVLLDNRKRYLNDVVISQGTLNASPVHPRDVFNAAIRERAASVVVVHNHPSGDPKPSREDIHVTQQLIKVGELVGIPIVDHIIIADEQYVSMLEQGLLRA